jgi:hypothetical protein
MGFRETGIEGLLWQRQVSLLHVIHASQSS